MRILVVVVVALGLTLALGACSREPAFEDRTARVTVDGEATTFQVDGCLLDGTTAYVVGRAEDGEVLQAVVGVEADGETGVPASTGLTLTEGGAPVTAFGEEAWARRGETDDAPGEITSARIKGSRIQASGSAQPVAIDGSPTSADPVPVSFDARCDAPDQG